MCNRYQGANDYGRLVARRLSLPERLSNAVKPEVHPRDQGYVVAADGLQAMGWGFPIVLKGKKGQPLKPKPVNNARDDKLLTWFWRDSFAARRCLIPVARWCEATGEYGATTETWFSLPDHDGFMTAGLWKNDPEWGRVYSMVMVPANEAVASVEHDRMPVILRDADWRTWMAGTPDDAMTLVKPWNGQLVVDQTDRLFWRG